VQMGTNQRLQASVSHVPGKEHLESDAWLQIPALSQTCCANWGKLLHLSDALASSSVK
jgi:hypothetical protein